MHIGERIYTLRTTLTLTQDKFAEALAISQKHISQIEKGSKVPSDQLLKLISLTFNTPEVWLRTGEGEMFLSPEAAMKQLMDRLNQQPDINDFYEFLLDHDLPLGTELPEHLKTEAKFYEEKTNEIMKKWEENDLEEPASLSLDTIPPITTDPEGEVEEAELGRMINTLKKVFAMGTSYRHWAKVQFDLAFPESTLKNLLSENNIKDYNASRKTKEKADPEQVCEPPVVYIPVISHIAAGRPIGVYDYIEGYLPIPASIAKSGTVFTRVKGDSMSSDGIWDGDIIQIRLQPTVENGEIAAVKIGDEVTLKRFYKLNDHYELRSSNPSYKTMNFGPDKPVTIIGKYLRKIDKEEANASMFPT